MSKRMKVLVSVLVAVVLLTVGGAATVMANDDGPTATDNETGRKGHQALLAEVVEILQVEYGYTDLTVDDLEAAFEQAQQEMREEAFLNETGRKGHQALLARVVEILIAQDEADQYKQWWEARPEVLGLGLFGRGLDGPGLHGSPGPSGLRGAFGPPGKHKEAGPPGKHKGAGPPGLFGGGHGGGFGPRLPRPGNGNGQ